MVDDDLALLVSTATEFEAQTKAAVLRDEGIDAVVTPYGPGSGGPGALAPAPSSASLWVPRRDLERARGILASRLEASQRIEWDDLELDAAEGPARRAARGMPLVVRAGLAVGLATLLLSLIWTFVVVFF